MNILRINNTLVVTLDNGAQYKTDNCTDALFEKVMHNLNNPNALVTIFNPEYGKVKTLLDGIDKSQYLSLRGNSIYIDSISQLTVPQDFAQAFLAAELSGDDDKVQAYLNFWTLLSLNPDSRVRNNIFWFLNRWGMVISKSGLIVGYRNVDIKREGAELDSTLIKYVTREWAYVRYKLKKSPANYLVGVDYSGDYIRINKTDADDSSTVIIGNLAEIYDKIVASQNEEVTVFTDHYSHSFEIRIGQVVQMERKSCDAIQENDCSRGLHVGGKDWLQKNYFGDVGLRVLVNPADIVAVPTQSDYGKMRTCAYYPVNVIEYDRDGNVIDDDIDSGFEDDFMSQICYTGEINNDDPYAYRLNLPDSPEYHRGQIMENLRQLALQHGRC